MASDIEVRIDDEALVKHLRDEPQKAERWLDGFTEDLVSRIMLSFGTSAPGRTYVREGSVHVASVPGSPPNVDIGTLRASIRWEPTGDLERTVYAGTEYAAFLEFGAEDVGLAARPFMTPAFADAQQRIEADARDNLGLDTP